MRYMRYTTHVKTETIVDGKNIPIVIQGDVEALINEKIQQWQRIVTFYQTLDEYRFDLVKYQSIDVQSVAGTVERYDFETSEIVLLLDDDFFTKKLIPGVNDSNATRLVWTEEFLDQFVVVIRGLFRFCADMEHGTPIADLQRFVCFDLIPKGGKVQ